MPSYFLVRVLNDHGAAYEVDPLHPGGSESYTDFWQLARLSGVPTCELHEADLESDNVYICAPWNGYCTAHFARPHKCRVIHYNIERPGLEIGEGADEMWVSDKTQLAMAADPRVRYVPLGGHVGLGGNPQYPKMWDFCPLAYAYGERARKLDKLSRLGYTIAPSTFDAYQRNIVLAHSRFGLMLHQTPHPIMTPLRAVLFACWKLPIVAEHVSDSYPYVFTAFDEAGQIAFAQPQAVMEAHVEFNHRVATEEFTFRACIEAAL